MDKMIFNFEHYMFKYYIFLTIFLLISAQICFAGSAGELGRHYGIRFTKPVIIGPLRELKQGKLPPPTVLDDPDKEAALGDGDRQESEYFSTFNPDVDFDEPLYTEPGKGLSDLYSMLHKKGSRVSHRIWPLMRIPADMLKELARKPAKPVRTAAKNHPPKGKKQK
jgi:hypothetical protein